MEAIMYVWGGNYFVMGGAVTSMVITRQISQLVVRSMLVEVD